MASYSAFYDACVFYPAPLRDLLMQLALTDVYRARWSDMVHDEWINALLEKRPELKDRITKTRELINSKVRDCLVTGFEDLIPSVSLPDPDDRHVLAAAIKGRCDVIVTFNLKDFPDENIGKYGIEAQHPDEFLTHLLDLAPGVVCGAVKTTRERLKNPPKSVAEFLNTLEKQGLVKFSANLRSFAETI